MTKIWIFEHSALMKPKGSPKKDSEKLVENIKNNGDLVYIVSNAKEALCSEIDTSYRYQTIDKQFHISSCLPDVMNSYIVDASKKKTVQRVLYVCGNGSTLGYAKSLELLLEGKTFTRLKTPKKPIPFGIYLIDGSHLPSDKGTVFEDIRDLYFSVYKTLPRKFLKKTQSESLTL